MTSVQIAIITGKRHKNVMQSIRNMEPAWEKACGLKFQLTTQEIPQPNGGTRAEPCYKLTKRECLYIATKFNDEARAKLILRWEQLERERQPKVPTQNRIPSGLSLMLTRRSPHHAEAVSAL